MRVPAVKKRRRFGKTVGEILRNKKGLSALDKAGFKESDIDFFQNNRGAAIWFLENRDDIAEHLTGRKSKRVVKLSSDLFESLIDVLARSECRFFACPGPGQRYKFGCTCMRCWNLRRLLLHAKREGIKLREGYEDFLTEKRER